jgi:hypothetical protein
MRVYDLEQGRSVERLDGHVRIKPLPTKLFTPGQRVFTPRYRPFIPNSAKLPPAVMLRFDRPLERAPARLLCCRLGCRVTEPGRAEGSSCFNELERENATLRRLLAVTLQCAGVSEQFAATSRAAPFRPAYHNAGAKAGQSITRKYNAFGTNKGFECTAPPAAWPWRSTAPQTAIVDAPESARRRTASSTSPAGMVEH